MGLPGAAGGELEEGDVARPRTGGGMNCPSRQRRGEIRHRHHPPQNRELGAQQAGEGEDLGEGDEHLGPGGPQDAGLPAEMVLDLALAGRRIERHRDAARELGAEEGDEVFEAAWGA